MHDSNFNYNINTLKNNTIYNETNENKYTYNFDELKNNKKYKKYMANKFYSKYYELCLKKIDFANKYDYTNIYFQVPHTLLNCSLYESKKCIKYIYDEIIKNNIFAYIINDNTIYISWNGTNTTNTIDYE